MTYWTNYYRDRPLAATTTASPFAQWLATEELNRATCDLELLVRCRTTHWLVDAGCGDGRDAIYWARTHGLNVLGIDLAESALSRTPDTATNDLGCNGGESRSEGRLTWQHGDLAELSSALVQHHSVAIIYARFSLHALAPVAAASFLQRAYELLCDGGLLLIEARSTQDPLMLSGAPVEDAINDPHGRLYDGGMHYRRFIAFHELLLSLSWLNFTIEYAGEQAAGWASTASEDPVVVRFKARK